MSRPARGAGSSAPPPARPRPGRRRPAPPQGSPARPRRRPACRLLRPAAGERLEGRQVASVVADETHRSQPGRQLGHHRALVRRDRRPQLPRHLAGLGHQPGAGCSPAANAAAQPARCGRLAKVQGDGQALALDQQTVGSGGVGPAATASTVACQREAAGSTTQPTAGGRSLQPVQPYQFGPFRPPRPAARAGTPPGARRPPPPGRSAGPGVPTAAATPGRGRASSGTSTMGARVPSKSRNTPEVPGDASQGPRRRRAPAGRVRRCRPGQGR